MQLDVVNCVHGKEEDGKHLQLDKDFPGNIQHDFRTNVTRKSDAKYLSTFSRIIA